ncbi:MAG: hypothetical protein AAFR88_06015 [Pseudomonadota bacterium]
MPSLPSKILARTATAAMAACLSIAPMPASAQIPVDVYYITSGVRFFERVQVGFVEISAINIFYDERCADPSFCLRSDDMLISVVLHTPEGLTEVVLSLGESVAVPGGRLMLTSAGTPPVDYGAIELNKYALELVYMPDEEFSE